MSQAIQRGEKISVLRKNKGISQELLAENCRISLRTIQRIESGDSVPRPYTLKVIADALEVTVESLNTLEENESKDITYTHGFDKLRLINLSALFILLLPLSNIILPILIWNKNRDFPAVNETGKKIITFHILWTITTLFLLVLVRISIASLNGSVAIGHFPPTLLLVYFFSVACNLFFILHAAFRLKKGEYTIFSFVPSLL